MTKAQQEDNSDSLNGRGGFGEESLQIEWTRVHRQFAAGGSRPFGFGPVPVEFDSVLIGVAEIQGFTDAVVRSAIQRDIRCDETAQGASEFGSRWIDDGQMVQAGGTFGGRRATHTFPRVQTDVVVISARGEECGLTAVALRDLEAQNIPIELQRTIEVRHFQVDVADADLRMQRAVVSWRLRHAC
jgi:hypothetical protein